MSVGPTKTQERIHFTGPLYSEILKNLRAKALKDLTGVPGFVSEIISNLRDEFNEFSEMIEAELFSKYNRALTITDKLDTDSKSDKKNEARRSS